jgi:hypothetical protein
MKGAKTARSNADVSEIDVSIDNVADTVADTHLPDRICGSKYLMKVCSAHVEQMKGIVFINSIPTLSLVQNVR